MITFILNFSQNFEHMLLQVGVLTISFNIFDVYYATQNNCKIKSNTDDESLYQKNALYLEIYLELNYVTVTVTDFWSSIFMTHILTDVRIFK